MARWCRLNSYRDYLQIPYFSPDGSELLSLQSRPMGPIKEGSRQSRFLFPLGAPIVLYNQPVLPRLAPLEPLYIAEGPSDCWALLSAGHKTVAIPSATTFTPAMAEQLNALHASLQTPFHIYPDADAPGEALFQQLATALPCLTRHDLPAGCKDFGDAWGSG